MSRVLFVCLHNAGRSQISQALFTRAAGDRHQAQSAGTTPGERVHPEVVEVMDELGIDLRAETPKLLTDELAQWADVVVTMGCGDQCPYIPGTRYLDWQLDDPKGRRLEEVRATRDEIAGRIDELIAELDSTIAITATDKEHPMKLDVFDPAMCCSTGVCGPSVDPDLARFAGDLEWLSSEGVQVTRYNLASEPQAFADSQVAKTALRERGDAALPLIVLNGQAVSFGVYPSRDALARWGGLQPVAISPDAAGDSGCCGGGSSC